MRSAILFMPVLSAILISSAVAAQDADPPLVIAANALTLRQWSGNVTADLNNHLRYPTFLSADWTSTGVVSVSFRADSAGRPMAVSLTRKSHSRALDLAALRAVGRLGNLRPMPSGFKANQLVVANIFFAADQKELERQIKVLRDDTRVRVARTDNPEPAIVLNTSSRAGPG